MIYKYMAKNHKIERRQFEASNEISFRAIEEDGKKYLVGYASVFSQRSKLLYENNKFFYEVIDARAFDEVLKDPELDVYLTFNHSRDKLIARTISGTLSLSTDEKGLLFRAELPNVSYANDVYELVSRGDLIENSFAFIVKRGDDEWTQDKDGTNIRLVKKVSKLIDVSVVTAGAYANTTVSARDAEVKLARGQKITIIVEETEDEEEPEEMSIEETPIVEENSEPVVETVVEPEVVEEKSEPNWNEIYSMRIKILKLKS